ncbi:hypothetical protein VNO80_16482 [Phaseolus coccineus]|uniref:Uncharacterized protein n=1 Tax=Phaseolus coccineus TaxID=3886 RepID=A0AAN9R3Z5_PHACN
MTITVLPPTTTIHSRNDAARLETTKSEVQIQIQGGCRRTSYVRVYYSASLLELITHHCLIINRGKEAYFGTKLNTMVLLVPSSLHVSFSLSSRFTVSDSKFSFHPPLAVSSITRTSQRAHCSLPSLFLSLTLIIRSNRQRHLRPRFLTSRQGRRAEPRAMGCSRNTRRGGSLPPAAVETAAAVRIHCAFLGYLTRRARRAEPRQWACSRNTHTAAHSLLRQGNGRRHEDPLCIPRLLTQQYTTFAAASHQADEVVGLSPANGPAPEYLLRRLTPSGVRGNGCRHEDPLCIPSGCMKLCMSPPKISGVHHPKPGAIPDNNGTVKALVRVHEDSRQWAAAAKLQF